MESFILGAVVAMALWLVMTLALRTPTDEQQQTTETQPKLRAYSTITENELLERLSQAAGSPVYLAILVVVDEKILDWNNQALEENVTHEQLRRRLGGVAALNELKEELEDKISEARERQKEKEKTA